MLRLDAIGLPESTALFGHDSMHLPLRLRRLPKARLLWLNQRVMHSDPCFAEVGGTAEAYAVHLLASCAFFMESGATAVDTTEVATGFADRYGGVGIGHNGGSGRAAVINGYHVKGIGRTPLVSVLTDDAHGSGGAYLEECVRETVFSEIVAAEFPCGSIPTLAIIDTGEIQDWGTDFEPQFERRCLLVRPCFVRPAHFERAPGFISANPKEGALDAARVQCCFESASELWGREALAKAFQRFWPLWAAQLAYAYIHRLPHGGNTTSNICLDGRLLDFGGMAAMPSWASISTTLGGPPVGADMVFLVQALRAQAPFWARYLDSDLGKPAQLDQLWSEVVQAYTAAMQVEMLRVAGLPRKEAQILIASDPDGQAAKALIRLLSHFRKEQFTIFDGTPVPRIAWDIDELWSENAPSHLKDLQALLRVKLPTPNAASQQQHTSLAVAAGRCAFLSASRHRLYRENVKSDTHSAVSGNLQGDELTLQMVSAYISRMVAQNRRDCKREPVHAVPIGFAQNATVSYALFTCQLTGQRFALEEWCAFDTKPSGFQDEPERRISISEMTQTAMVFDDESRPKFNGTVAAATC